VLKLIVMSRISGVIPEGSVSGDDNSTALRAEIAIER
jgi:hypothetical protein